MNAFMWGAHIILAILYIAGGGWKVVGKSDDLEKSMPGFSVRQIRAIGTAEAIAGVGLVVPIAATVLMPLAGLAGLFLAIEGGVFVVYHLHHGGRGPAFASFLLGCLGGVIAWTRFTL